MNRAQALRPNAVRFIVMGALWIKFRGTRFPLARGETTIGRGPFCSIVVGDALVSREHAAIHFDGETTEIRDLGSSNGTYVNDRKIASPQTLQIGDTIQLGADLLEVLPAEQSSRFRAGGDGADATDVHAITVELAEAMIVSAVESGSEAAVAQSLRECIEELAEGHATRKAVLTRSQVVRLTAAIERVGGWGEGASTDAWRTSALAALHRGSVALDG